MANRETKNPGESEPNKIESLFEFKENNLEGRWLVLTGEAGSQVEGAFYSPDKEKDNHELIIFFPGMPGDGVVWFEEKQLRALLDQGYSVFSCRHQGLQYGDKNERYVHNSQRANVGNLNEVPVNVDDWVNEPKVAIEGFAKDPNIKAINLIAHSFSGLSVANSLIELQRKSQDREDDPLDKVKKWVVLSGFLSNLREEGFWDPNKKSLNLDLFHGFFEYVKEAGLYNLDNPDESLEQLKATFIKMKDNLKDIPKEIGVVGVYPEGDRQISINAGLDLQENLGRGVIIDDQTFRAERFSAEADPHDFPHLAPQTLLRLLKMKDSKHKHIFTVKEPDPTK